MTRGYSTLTSATWPPLVTKLGDGGEENLTLAGVSLADVARAVLTDLGLLDGIGDTFLCNRLVEEQLATLLTRRSGQVTLIAERVRAWAARWREQMADRRAQAC